MVFYIQFDIYIYTVILCRPIIFGIFAENQIWRNPHGYLLIKFIKNKMVTNIDVNEIIAQKVEKDNAIKEQQEKKKPQHKYWK